MHCPESTINDEFLKISENNSEKIKNTNFNNLLSSPYISIVIPLYNEEKSIIDVIKKIPESSLFEILIIDDGSTDNSVKKIKRTGRDVKLIQHDKNQGYGAAILSGIYNSNGEIIVTLDSDGQHDPRDIPKLIKPIIENKVDIVIGSRYLGNCNYNVPLHTRAGEKFIQTFLWLMYRQDISNNQSGFRAFNRKSIEIFENSIFNQYGLCTQMLFEAGCKMLRIREIPITLHPRYYGISRIRIVRLIRSILTCVILYSFKRIINDLFPNSTFPKKFLIFNKFLLRNK